MRGSAVFRTGVAPGGALAGPWVKNPLWTRARAVPSLDLRFAENKSLVDATTGAQLVTFTRASSGTFVGSDGLIQTAATNEPRFDHNPTTGESLGLLVEEARTNSIPNNTGVGAVAGAPGTLPTNWTWNTTGGASTEVVGTGTENGIAYVDVRLFGTLSSAPSIQFVANTAIAATTGQAWTESFYCKIISLVSGTPDPRLRIVERSGAGSYLTEGNQPFTPGISSASLIASRFTFTRTLANALTGYAIPALLFNQGSGAIDVTFRIGLPQLEQGAFATSPVLTSTATVTRAADVASIGSSNYSSWANNTQGTLFALAGRLEGASGGTTTIGQLDDGTTTNRILLGIGSTGASGQNIGVAITSNVQEVTFQGIASAGGNRVAFAYALNDYGLSLNGATPLSDTSAAVPGGIATLRIGNNTGSFLSGHIRRLCFWPTRLSNTTLQQITQP